MQLSNSALQRFATLYPADAAYFFSGPPYCSLAVKDFGYQNPFAFTPNEGTPDNNSDNEKDDDNDNEISNENNRNSNQWYFGDECFD